MKCFYAKYILRMVFSFYRIKSLFQFQKPLDTVFSGIEFFCTAHVLYCTIYLLYYYRSGTSLFSLIPSSPNFFHANILILCTYTSILSKLDIRLLRLFPLKRDTFQSEMYVNYLRTFLFTLSVKCSHYSTPSPILKRLT